MHPDEPTMIQMPYPSCTGTGEDPQDTEDLAVGDDGLAAPLACLQVPARPAPRRYYEF